MTADQMRADLALRGWVPIGRNYFKVVPEGVLSAHPDALRVYLRPAAADDEDVEIMHEQIAAYENGAGYDIDY